MQDLVRMAFFHVYKNERVFSKCRSCKYAACSLNFINRSGITEEHSTSQALESILIFYYLLFFFRATFNKILQILSLKSYSEGTHCYFLGMLIVYFLRNNSLTDSSHKTLLKFSVICFALFAKKIIVLFCVPVNSSITKYSMLQVVSKNI